MSQKTYHRETETWCDEKDCNVRTIPVRASSPDDYQSYSNTLKAIGWSARRKKSSESFVTNSWRHRCPKCTKELGRIR